MRHDRDVLDVLQSLSPRELSAPPPAFEPEDETPIPRSQVEAELEPLTPYPMAIDEIARAAGLGMARCATILVELQLAGEAYTLPGALAARTVGP